MSRLFTSVIVVVQGLIAAEHRTDRRVSRTLTPHWLEWAVWLFQARRCISTMVKDGVYFSYT